MIPTAIADLLLVLHLAFIVFVVFGGFLVLKCEKVAILHIPCALWGAFVELSGRVCPLTPLEFYFRKMAGEGTFSGGFIEHYVMPLVYPTGLTRGMQISLGIIVLIINLFIYWKVLFNRRRNK